MNIVVMETEKTEFNTHDHNDIHNDDKIYDTIMMISKKRIKYDDTYDNANNAYKGPTFILVYNTGRITC